MRLGGWVPISKDFLKELPKDRPYTTLEAAFSLQVDYDKGRDVSIKGCSEQWQWSRKRVRNFLNRMGIEIIYPENTKIKQNQRGQIGLQIGDR